MAKRPGLTYEKTLDQERQAIVCRPAGKLVGCTATYEFLEDIRDDVNVHGEQAGQVDSRRCRQEYAAHFGSHVPVVGG